MPDLDFRLSPVETTAEMHEARHVIPDERLSLARLDIVEFGVHDRSGDLWHLDGEEAAETTALLCPIEDPPVNTDMVGGLAPRSRPTRDGADRGRTGGT